MFRPEDNLESDYARDALRQLYVLIYGGKVEGCPLLTFEAATGLSLSDDNGLKDELPPITTFLNRMLALTIAMQDIVFAAFEDLLVRRIEGAVASGAYEVGLETLQAESFTVDARRTIYTHPGTGAETRLLTLTRKDRNDPLGLDDALALGVEPKARLLVNAKSGRAAVAVPARSLLLDDGGVERRIRLVRPMERPTMAANALAGSHWEESAPEGFAEAWSAELATVPEFVTSTLHVVAGLLLPIWRRLPNESTRVYRLQTDASERLVGRRVSPAWVAVTLGADALMLAPEAAWPLLEAGDAALHIAEGQRLERVRAMQVYRIELVGFNDLAVERLKALGLISEIVSWKLRLFVPTGAAGADVLARLLERYPLQRVVERAAAKAA